MARFETQGLHKLPVQDIRDISEIKTAFYIADIPEGRYLLQKIALE